MTVAYITGASAGLGRAVAHAFSADGMTIGLIARDGDALRRTAAGLPGPAAWAAADIARPEQLAQATQILAAEIGPPDIWVNNAMATIFSRFADIAPAEFAQACNITFLGSVYGLQQALHYMIPRGCGHIIQIGSALAYRAIPLQAPYCASKLAIRGAVDSLRCELIHDKSPLRVTMVHMPAMNTPQFDWARRHVAQEPQPVPPIYDPQACAAAVLWASRHPHMREVWVGRPTIQAIIGNKLMPAFMDRYMARHAFEAQYERPAATADTDGNLFQSVGAAHALKGRFADREIRKVFWVGTSERREWLLVAGLLLLAVIVAAALLAI
jgi:NADP-dependent 3-hydroxy acid dehydrogenase YdfG